MYRIKNCIWKLYEKSGTAVLGLSFISVIHHTLVHSTAHHSAIYNDKFLLCVENVQIYRLFQVIQIIEQ